MINDDGVMQSEAHSRWDESYDEMTDELTSEQHPLDGAEAQKLLGRLREWFEQESRRQAHNRFQMAMDEDYYDSLQWSEEDAAVLLDRGQSPIVYNEIKPAIDWMIGTERRTRIDYKILPRQKEGGKDAEVKTDLMKYLSDVNDEPFQRSEAFSQMIKAGLSWIEVGVRGDSTDEPIFYRHQSWRHILYDSNAVARDLSDARYVFRWKYVDKDIAETYFPGRESIIRQSCTDGTDVSKDEANDLWYMGTRVTEPGYDYSTSGFGKYRPYDGSAFAYSTRERVKLMECWYRLPKRVSYFQDGDMAGQPVPDDMDPLEAAAVSIYDKIEMQVRVAIYTDSGLLYEGPSPYKHGRFPFVAAWAYRRARDNAPYGPIRAMRDSQDSLNKRGSKALWILSSNRIVMEAGAVDDIDLLREEAARPDGILIKNPGTEFVLDRDVQLAREHLMLMERDAQYLRNVSGVTAENLGRQTNADSGKAISARQEQGGVVTTEVFDNFAFAVKQAGKIQLALVEQFYGQPKSIRTQQSNGDAQFIDINQPDPETGEVNDITAFQAEYVMTEQNYKSSLRVAMFESLFEIVSRLAQMAPQVALNLLDLLVDAADIPNREALVSRIRQINGQRDPDREPTPEEQAAAQKQQQLVEVQQQLTLEQFRAELEATLAKAEKMRGDSINKRLDALYSSIQSAQIVATAPGVAPIADDIARSAGFRDQTPEVDAEDHQRMAEQQQAQVQEQQAALEQEAMIQVEQQAQMQGEPQAPAGVTQPQADPQSPFEGARQGIETPENDGVM